MLHKQKSVPPEPYFSAALYLLYQVALFIRNHSKDIGHEQLSDLADAIHNVPESLTEYGHYFDEKKIREIYLAGYDLKWAKSPDDFSLLRTLDAGVKRVEQWRGGNGIRTEDAARIRTIAAERGLGSYMNDTKWREVCEAFRLWREPPRYRVHDVLAADGYISEWDREWYYHPLPYVSIQWLEVELSEEQIPAALAVCKGVGAPAERSPVGLRIWGWVGSANRPQFT
jgi:hypothetical protein